MRLDDIKMLPCCGTDGIDSNRDDRQMQMTLWKVHCFILDTSVQCYRSSGAVSKKNNLKVRVADHKRSTPHDSGSKSERNELT